MTPAERTDRMIGRIAREHGVTVEMIKGRARYPRKLIEARFETYALLHRKGWSLPMIGRHLNRDHTTVLHGLRQVTAR